MKKLVIATIAALSLAAATAADAKSRHARPADQRVSAGWHAGPVSPRPGYLDYLVRSPSFPRHCVSDGGYGRVDFSSC